MVFLSEWLISYALKTPASAAYSRAVGHVLTRRRQVPSVAPTDSRSGDLQRGTGDPAPIATTADNHAAPRPFQGPGGVRSGVGINSAEAGSSRA